MTLITDNKAIADFCAQAQQYSSVTIDTEFIREKTYYPQLCLIQLAHENAHVAIDPLAKNVDLTPLYELLANPNVVKVFHACKQDVEIFYYLTGTTPTPIFDTQVAAAFCGYGESVGYEALVKHICNAALDKSSRFTDWAKRPLTDKQLDYALGDVTYLRDIYKTLVSTLENAERLEWVAQEHKPLHEISSYETQPNDAWKRLKSGRLKSKQLAVLREMAAWRETTAKERDVPRGRIVRDEILLEIAQVMPAKSEDVTGLRSVDRRISGDTIEALIEATSKALSQPVDSYPKAKKMLRPDASHMTKLAMLQLLLKVIAEKAEIAPSIIANKSDLEAIAYGNETKVSEGWRHEVFGKQADLLLAGKLKLSLDPAQQTIVLESD